jgi:hypothetical protein
MTKRIGLQHRGFRSALSFLVALLLIGSISYLGIRTYQASHAASGVSIYVTPDTAPATSGSSLSVTIHENSGAEPVNSVQASLNYDSNKLQFVSITEGGSFPVIAATNTDTAGVIRIGRGNSDTSVTGDKPVVTVNFKVVGNSGDAVLSIDKAYSLLVSSSSNKDILQNVGGGSYTIASTASAVSTNPILYVTPASNSYVAGAAVAATVRLNAYTAGVTTIEAAIKYPTDKLQYVGVSEGGIFPTQQRTNNTNGVVDIIRSIPGGANGISGDNPVVTINFKAIASGTAALTLAGASSAYDNSGTGANILNIAGSSGSTYTLAAAAGAAAPQTTETPPAVSDSNNNDQPVADVTPPSNAMKVSAKKNSNGTVSLSTAADGSVLTELGGQVDLTPVIDSALLAKNPNETISKVEYYIDNKLVSTQTNAPYKFSFDTNSLRNGQYSMVVKTYYSSGTVDTRADKILVNNKVTLAYVMRHYTVNIGVVIAVLVMLALIMWKLVIPRASARHARNVSFDHDALYGFSGQNSGGGPVAGDPTVISPTTSTDSSSPDGGIAGLPPQASSAAMMTSALPMNGASMQPVSTQPQIIQPTLPTPTATVTPTVVPAATMPTLIATPALVPAPAPAPIIPATPAPSVGLPSLQGPAPAAVVSEPVAPSVAVSGFTPQPTVTAPIRPMPVAPSVPPQPVAPGPTITDYQFQPTRPTITVPVASASPSSTISSASVQTPVFRPDISPAPQVFPPQHT